MVPLAVRVGEFVAGIRLEGLPASTIRSVKRLVLDTVGCALGAVGCPPASIVERALTGTIYGNGSCTIIGSKRTMSLEGALIINGILTRYLDFMDVYYSPAGACHPSENIPVALGICEAVGAPGARLIEAIVAGYEAQLRLSEAFSFQACGLHHVSAVGFVAPLVVGKAMGLGPAELAHALALGGARHLALGVIARGQISMAKAVGYPLGAVDAVLTVRLAANGMTGPLEVFEWLLSRVGPPGAKEQGAAVNLDPGRFLLERVSLKRFPVQFELQAPVEAAVKLHPQVKEPLTEVEQVEVDTHEHVVRRTADPAKFRPETRETADHSLPCSVALALLDGDVTPQQFENERWRSPEVLALMGRIVVRGDPRLDSLYPGGRAASVTVRLRDGGVLRELVGVPEGDADRPMDDAALERKFTTLATPVLGNQGARAVRDAIQHLEELRHVGLLTALLKGQCQATCSRTVPGELLCGP